MAVTIPVTVTGTAQTGLTNPTYTTATDRAVESNVLQAVITTLGGTQAGVDAHSISRPFVLSVARPKQFNALGKPNPTTGLIASVPYNEYRGKTVKGVLPLAGQPSKNLIIETTIKVPAGADTADPVNIRAALSAHFGMLHGVSAGFGDTTVTGVL